MKAIDIRKKFIEFFSNHQHSVIPGSSLIPKMIHVCYLLLQECTH
jgi:alanyl-tRNA synthetase